MDWIKSTVFLEISTEQWLFCLAAIVISFIVIRAAWSLLIARLTKLFAHTSNQLDDLILEIIKSTGSFTFLLISVLIGVQFLDIPERLAETIDHLWFVVIGIQAAVWLSKAVTLWAKGRLHPHGLQDQNPVITRVISWILKTMLWSILLLAVLSNLGVNITAFIASLGVGGIAVALAVQNVLADLFASLAIGLDKPFEVGDFIISGEILGSVELVGLKTTHIRSLDGEQIIISNTELLKRVIRNYKRMATRRVAFAFGVTYDTPIEKIKEIPAAVKKIVEGAGDLRFDRAHFKGFGASSLDFEVVYILNSGDYNIYMDTQQKINLDIMAELQAREVDFAFPTMTLDLSRAGPALAEYEKEKAYRSSQDNQKPNTTSH
jgi:small-conductance mechanosensitive channel